MVRSIAAILVCRGMASESGVLMQSQANTDAALAFENSHMMHSMQIRSEGSAHSRFDKMKQSTKEIEEFYKGLLQNMVSSGSMDDPDTGKPWVPPAGVLDIVRAQFKLLRDELTKENTDNKGILEEAHEEVAKCNADRLSAWPSVQSSKSDVNQQRTAHTNCRSDEDLEIDDMERKCALFDQISNKCDEHQDWYANYEHDTNALKDVVTKATDCKDAVDTLKVTASDCDEKQAVFQGGFCSYAAHLDVVCGELESCYSTATASLKKTEDAIRALMSEQQAIFKMVGKVSCYLGLLTGAKTNAMPSTIEINKCGSEEIDASSLLITFPPVTPRDPCRQDSSVAEASGNFPSVNFCPGEDAWYNAEYTGALLNHDKLTETNDAGFEKC